MEIISKRKRIEVENYQLCFDYEGERGSGFAFDCDKDGKVDETKLQAEKPIAWESYQTCLKGEITVHREGEGSKTLKIQAPYVQHWTHSYTEPAIGRCHCGEEVALDGFTNTCDKCHTDYNMSVQELAPREFWGEETGESLSDILSIDSNSTEDLLD